MKKFDVLCVGATAFDLTFCVGRQPGPDDKINARELVMCGGGPAANAALAVAKMGLRTAFIGYLGRDDWGERHQCELKQAGVCTDFIVRGWAPTPLSVTIVKPDGKRTLVNYRNPEARVGTDQSIPADIEASVILMDGHEPVVSAMLLETGWAGKSITVLDAGSVNPGTAALYNKVDYLVCSEKFALNISRKNDVEQALLYLADRRDNVVITIGRKGLLWKRGRQTGKLPAFKVKACDTTGAGDVFHGVFASCLALGMEWQSILVWSSAAAALSCQKIGGQTGIPQKSDIEHFLRSRAPAFLRQAEDRAKPV